MKKIIVICHCLEILALSVWVGGLIVIVAAVIPALFTTAPNMEVGGRLLRRIFQGYDRLVWVGAGLLIGGMVVRGWKRPYESARVERHDMILLGGMLLVAALLTFSLNPEAVRLQEVAFHAPDAVAKKTAYEAFFRFHWVIRGFYFASLILGVGLLWVRVRRWVA